MSRPDRFWEKVVPAVLLAPDEPAPAPGREPRTGPDWVADVAVFVVAMVAGGLILGLTRHDQAGPRQVLPPAVDLAVALLCATMLWWRRRWPVGVAVATVVVGTLSISATAAGLIALFSLAVHRSPPRVVVVACLWVPTALACAIALGRTDLLSVAGWTVLLAVAAIAWGMFVRARRQLLLTLRERAERAEADQLLHADAARMAERSRIAREMHDLLAHRMSLVALHAGALEMRPDLPAEQVRETAELLRSTARQALEELRGVIGVLREEPGQARAPTAPQPTLADIPRLVEETRRAGVRLVLEMNVDQPATASGALGRDAYRIVQEALTNIAKHARGTDGRIQVNGAPGQGLHLRVSNRLPLRVPAGSTLPGAGAGLLGLQERVTLAGGVLVHGPDGAGNFVVDADLRW
jgi:signal transduction histidine kinase